MRVELNTNVVDSIVPDTYGTEFCYEIREDCWEDFKQMMIDKAEEYLTEFLKVTDFKDAKLTMKDFYSPREYNFRTDDIGFELEFDDSMIDKIAEKVEMNEKFSFWIAQKYKSYDGFISFMPDTMHEFYECLYDESDVWKAIAEYLSYQINENFNLNNERKNYIEDCWEYARENGLDYDEEDEEESIC